jgi:hypothetical protein
MVSNVDPVTGAISVNRNWTKKGDPYTIQQQRYGADMIQSGVNNNNVSQIDQGLLILQWGFDRQDPVSGGFPDSGDPFHSTSFFLEAATRSGILLREYEYATYAANINYISGRSVRIADWMLTNSVKTTGDNNNAPYGHRRFLCGAAFMQTAELSGSSSQLISTHANAADAYMNAGFALQQFDGSFLEKGLPDSSYQMVGMTMAARYAMSCPRFLMVDPTKRCLDRGCNWELGYINPDGSVITIVGSRTDVESGVSGAPKSVDFKHLIEGFVFGYGLLSNMTYLDAATRIAHKKGWA